MRAIFMGTPEFAVPSLLALHALAEIEVVGVVTRLDKPVGRGHALEAPPVKLAAQRQQLPVLQPGSLRKPAALAALSALAPDVIIVAAFGQILPPAVLELPQHGCLNVHASLLPRYRGASPIATALLDGMAETGNTIMLMDAGLDTGAMLAQAAIPIVPDETTATLTSRLAQQGAELLTATLPHWLAGAITPTPQDNAQATLTRLIHKEDGVIDWTQSAEHIERRVRAFTPWPGTTTQWRGQPLKILATHLPSPDDMLSSSIDAAMSPGTIITWGRGASARVGILCGKKSLLVLDVLQLAGKRALPAADVVRGQPALVDATLPS